MNVLGAAISLNLTRIISLIILDIWMYCSDDYKDTLVRKHDKRSFTGWDEYMKVGFYGAILECLGWWNLNICFLFTGYLSKNAISTQVVIM